MTVWIYKPDLDSKKADPRTMYFEPGAHTPDRENWVRLIADNGEIPRCAREACDLLDGPFGILNKVAAVTAAVRSGNPIPKYRLAELAAREVSVGGDLQEVRRKLGEIR